jgi:hypothetical protein
VFAQRADGERLTIFGDIMNWKGLEGARFNLEIVMLEQLKVRTFKIFKIISWKIKILKNNNLERSKS